MRLRAGTGWREQGDTNPASTVTYAEVMADFGRAEGRISPNLFLAPADMPRSKAERTSREAVYYTISREHTPYAKSRVQLYTFADGAE